MDDIAVRLSNQLYEEDFYAWTQAQVALLRQGRFEDADVANLLEEIDSLGRTQVAELHSRLRVLIHHLLKQIFQPGKASRSWTTTIIVQRQDLRRHLKQNPSLKAKIAEIFEEAYADARKVAASETGLASKTFPEEPPFTYEQAMDEDFWPGRSIATRQSEAKG